MLIDSRNLRPHVPWILTTLLIAVVALLTTMYLVFTNNEWPSGSSASCFMWGVFGAGIITFEMLLWPRKLLRSWRIGRVQTWMRAHIWLGLLTLPLAVCHSGFRLGGMLSTTLMVLLTIVVVSGVWGLIVQQILPRRLLDDVPEETIYSQIDYVSHRLAEEAREAVLAICGESTDEERQERGRRPKRGSEASLALLTFCDETVVPFLQGSAPRRSPLRSAAESAALFRALRVRLESSTHEAVATLEHFCERRRQFEYQARLHVWLHNWLLIHVPLSVALVFVLLVHVGMAMRYW